MQPDPRSAASAALLFNTERHAESPKPPSPTWTGILIHAPESVVLGARPPVAVLRATYRIRGTDYPDKARWRVVATDPATRQSVAAEPGQRDPSPVAPDPEGDQPLDAETKARIFYNGHVNLEIFLTLNLPLRAANWVLRLDLGPLRSNEVGFRVLAR